MTREAWLLLRGGRLWGGGKREGKSVHPFEGVKDCLGFFRDAPPAVVIIVFSFANGVGFARAEAFEV